VNQRPTTEEVALVDMLDHLLNRGVALVGKSTIAVGDVDLIYLGINLVLSSVETLQQGQEDAGDGAPEGDDRLPGGPELLIRPLSPGGQGDSARSSGESFSMGEPPRSPGGTERPSPKDGEGDPVRQSPERGLAQLVLTIIELLRQLVERQAVRRMAGGSLPDEKVEAMGRVLMELETKMGELREIFQLEERDIQVDLGPLGRLL
jgi:hypothetical protein